MFPFVVRDSVGCLYFSVFPSFGVAGAGRCNRAMLIGVGVGVGVVVVVVVDVTVTVTVRCCFASSLRLVQRGQVKWANWDALSSLTCRIPVYDMSIKIVFCLHLALLVIATRKTPATTEGPLLDMPCIEDMTDSTEPKYDGQ